MNLLTSIFLSLLVSLFVANDCMPGTYIARKGKCRQCPKGTFQASINKYACRPCSRGNIAANVGSSSCTRCQPNSRPNKRMDKCFCKYGTILQGNKCRPCRPGSVFSKTASYLGGQTKGCLSCYSGTFQPEEGKNSCLPCPPGSFSENGATKCLFCKENQNYDKTIHKCVTCEAEFFFEEFSGCIKCPRNRFKPKKGKGTCLPCPIGSYSIPGSTKCTPCPEGTVLLASGECRSCAAGSHFNTETGKCIKCFPHSFMPYENVRNSCFLSSEKRFSLRGATKCVKCPKNTFLQRDGTCKACPAGSVYMRYQLNCLECKLNMFTRGDMNRCEECTIGSYALPGSTSCFSCPAGEALILEEKGCGVCPAGHMYDRYKAKRKKCPRGSVRPNQGIEDCISCPWRKDSNKDRTECV